MRPAVGTLRATLLAAGSLTCPAAAQCGLDTLAGDAFSQNFGAAVALDAERLVVGDDLADALTHDAGAAFIFRREGDAWVLEAKLVAHDGQPGDYFGRAMALDGDGLVIGASWDDGQRGSAYVARRVGTSWTLEAKLVGSDSVAGDHFGNSVALDGDLAVIGARDSDAQGFGSGSAYVFRRTASGWVQEAMLIRDDGAPDQAFGTSVALDDRTAVVGAPGDDEFGEAAGAAYVYEGSGGVWVGTIKLRAPSAKPFDAFGASVSIDADLVAAGAPSVTYPGQAHLFRRVGGNWSAEANLASAGSLVSNDEFGRPVSVHGERVLVGEGQGGFAIGSGAAHLFERVGGAWLLGARYTAPVPLVLTGFGRVSALHGDVVAVGQPASGTASLHAATTALPAWVFLGDGLAGDLGTPCLVGAGTLAAGDPVTVTLSGAQPDSLAILVFGLSTVHDLFEGGVLVPSPDTFVKNLPTGPAGSIEIAATTPGLPAGLTFYLQYWIADTTAPLGLSASNAISGTVP